VGARAGDQAVSIAIAVVFAAVIVCAAISVAPLASSYQWWPTHPAAGFEQRTLQKHAAVVVLLSLVDYGALWALSKGAVVSTVAIAMCTAAALPALLSWPTTSCVLIPLGWVRATYAFNRWFGRRWVRDPIGGALLAAALAWARRPSQSGRRFLIERLSARPHAGAGIVAWGIVVETDDPSASRALFASIDHLDPATLPPLARKIALEHRIAALMWEGRWHDVEALATDELSPSPFVRLAASLAIHRRSGDRFGAVVWAWFCTGRWRSLWCWLARARRWSAWIRVDERMSAAANSGLHPADAALSLHLEAARTHLERPVDPEAIARLARVWQGTLADYALFQLLRGRALALDTCAVPYRCLSLLRRQVMADLGTLVAASPTPISLDNELLIGARSQYAKTGGAQLRTLGSRLATGLCRQTETMRVWQAWADLAGRYKTVVGVAPTTSPDLLRGLLEHMTAFALWFQGHRQRVHAAAIFAWIADQAGRVGDDETAAYHQQLVEFAWLQQPARGMP
jgi:hypothetical protein